MLYIFGGGGGLLGAKLRVFCLLGLRAAQTPAAVWTLEFIVLTTRFAAEIFILDNVAQNIWNGNWLNAER
jgi:hypothetical protein